VGVKKVAGAARHNLIYQFITESNLVSAAAVLLALLMVSALMPAFNIFIGKSLTTALLWDARMLLILAGFTLFLGTLSGSYPAFYLSRFKPAIAIKGFSSGSKKTGTIRQGLVIFQFALSIMLILATLVAQEQISFIRHKDLGFRKDQIVVLDINSGGVRKGYETIRNEIARIPLVSSVSVSSRVPGEWKNLPQVDVSLSGREEQQKLYFIGIDDTFVKTFNIELISGRNFSGDPGDSASFIINETAARQMGFADPLSETLSVESVNYAVSESKLDQPFKGKIIGIVRDFHFQSLHQKIGPLLLACHNNPVHNIDYFSVRLNPGDWQSSLKDMEKALQMVDPAHQIEYNFLDERLADFYRQDVKRGQFFTLAAGVSITLACLGLFSLASFMTEQRTKEIGIRKALGATSRQIVMMLSANYIKLVFAGFLVATPLAIWLLNQWLQSFAYRIEIGWVSITAACVASLFVALLTVGYKSLSAATENPVNSLRSE
jgi:putative ABC transport system permease protein